MKIEAKFKNPIKIKLQKKGSILLKNNPSDADYPLTPGVMLGDEHYGIIIIVDYNNSQKEMVYPTQCRIEGLGIEKGKLKIYEQYKRTPWTFDGTTGRLEKSTYNNFTSEGIEKMTAESEEYGISYDKPIFMNPIDIKYAPNYPKNSTITLKGLSQDKDKVPLSPGVILGESHYGYRLTIESKEEKKVIEIPTENRIEAIGQENPNQGDIKIYENGKYHPWTLDCHGNITQQARYNEHSRRDKQFLLEKKRKRK